MPDLSGGRALFYSLKLNKMKSINIKLMLALIFLAATVTLSILLTYDVIKIY